MGKNNRERNKVRTTEKEQNPTYFVKDCNFSEMNHRFVDNRESDDFVSKSYTEKEIRSPTTSDSQKT
jgi:hypothetical protein